MDEISDLNNTIIMYESPNRILSTLEYIKNNNKFNNTNIVIIREMTKIFEEVIRGKVD